MTDSIEFDEAAHSAAYRGVRERVVACVQEASPESLDAIAMATPQWRTRDVLAHLVGVASDVLAGNITDAGGERWTAAQVQARYDPPVAALVAEWTETGPRLDELILGLPTSITGQLIFDATTHEHDLRQALGCPGARDADALAMGLVWVVNALGQFYDAAGDPALRFESERGGATAGSGTVGATVGASTFELVRAVTGRRTLAEMSKYEWTPDAQPDRLVALPLFRAVATSLGE